MKLRKLKNVKWNTITLRAGYFFWILFIISGCFHLFVLPDSDDVTRAKGIKDTCYTTDKLIAFVECKGVYDWFIVEIFMNVFSFVMQSPIFFLWVPPATFLSLISFILLIYPVYFHIKTLYKRFSN